MKLKTLLFWMMGSTLLVTGLQFYEEELPGSLGPAYAQTGILGNAEEDQAASEATPADDSAGGETVGLPKPVPAISPETFRLIETLERKNRELQQREEKIQLKEDQLKLMEQKIQEDLKKIDQALERSQEQIGIQKKMIRQNVEALVKAYSNMKPEEAARLLEAVDEDLALQIIRGMKSKVAGKVLSQLDVKVAKNISEKLAGQERKKPSR